MRMHRVLLGAFWLTLAVVALTGCNTGKGVVDPAVQFATLRIANLIPDASGPLNVTLDSNTFASGLNFEGLTQYQQIDSGSRVIQAFATGGIDIGADRFNSHYATLNFTGTINYTLVAYGSVAEPTVVLVSDVAIDPGAGLFNLRLVNAATGVSAVDIYVTAPGANLDAAAPSIASVSLGTASGFVTLPAGNIEIRVRPTPRKSFTIRRRNRSANTPR